MPPAALQPLPEALLTVDLKGIVGLELAGSRLTEHRKHVHEVVEGEVPLPVLRKSLHNPFLEGILPELQHLDDEAHGHMDKGVLPVVHWEEVGDQFIESHVQLEDVLLTEEGSVWVVVCLFPMVAVVPSLNHLGLTFHQHCPSPRPVALSRS